VTLWKYKSNGTHTFNFNFIKVKIKTEEHTIRCSKSNGVASTNSIISYITFNYLFHISLLENLGLTRNTLFGSYPTQAKLNIIHDRADHT